MHAARLYRIESAARLGSDDLAGERRHAEVVAGLEALRADIQKALAAPAVAAAPTAPDDTAREMLDLYKRELNEARKLKNELTSIREAIARTKSEIASLHRARTDGGAIDRVTDELDAVVHGTEAATNTILEASEIIDQQSRNLVAKLGGDDQGMAADIQDQVVRVFEACNFQDLTGQRITKVVNVLRFVEDRVEHMLEIWGGLDAFADVAPSADLDARDGDRALLNGPALPADDGRATQSMIDALFN
jgi:chemotaxis protein CheZ